MAAGPPWLIDSNILLRWVQPNDPDYSVVASALETLAKRGAVLCYTSQNVAEFWSACTRPVDRNGFGLTPGRQIAAPRLSSRGYICFPTVCRFIRNGDD